MNLKVLAGGSLAAGLIIGAGARLASDSHFDAKRAPVIASRDAAQHRLDTETLDPATRTELQRQAGAQVPWTLSPTLAIAGGTSALAFAFGQSMAEMGGGFKVGWEPINAVTGPLAAGILGGLLLATIIDRD